MWLNGFEPGMRRVCPGLAPRPTPGWAAPAWIAANWAPPVCASMD